MNGDNQNICLHLTDIEIYTEEVYRKLNEYGKIEDIPDILMILDLNEIYLVLINGIWVISCVPIPNCKSAVWDIDKNDISFLP